MRDMDIDDDDDGGSDGSSGGGGGGGYSRYPAKASCWPLG